MPECLDDWSRNLALLIQDRCKEWRLQDPQANIQADNDQQRTDEERDAPGKAGDETCACSALDNVDDNS